MTQKSKDKINADIRRLFTGSPLGKRVLSAMMLRNYVFDTILIGRDQTDRDSMEGRRALILEILDVCRGPMTPDQFIDASTGAIKDRTAENNQHDPLEGA